MKKSFVIIFTVILAGGTSGCGARSGTGISKETGGAVLGGIAGGVLGSRIGGGRGRTIATIGGAILGGLLGGSIGRQLDERDKLLMANQTQVALEKTPSGTASEWRNPDTGHSGTITPEAAYRSEEGVVCREFQQTVTIGGKSEEAYGRACRQADGSWKIINTN